MFREELIRNAVYATIDQISHGDYNPALAQTAQFKKQLLARLEDAFMRHMPGELRRGDWEYVLDGKYEDPESLALKLIHVRRPADQPQAPAAAALLALFFLMAGFLYLMARCRCENDGVRREIAEFLQKVNSGEVKR